MKGFLGILIAAQLLATPAFVGADIVDNEETVILLEQGDDSDDKEHDRSEAFKWYYRTHNGVEQKRLWSLTYGYWVTDWIDCE